jgi:hypothetical protein
MKHSSRVGTGLTGFGKEKTVTADLAVPTFTKKRKGGPATGASLTFQDLTTINQTSLAGSETPVTGAQGASVNTTITYDAQFLTSHTGNIGLEFVGNGSNSVQPLLGGECGITQIN